MHDPVHGPMELMPCQLELLRTPHFQRLTRLKQLGVSHLVFPGATHTRAEHCLGVAWLVRLLVRSLRLHQPEIDLTERDERLLVLAAQAHDLGHGVASHAFEGWLHESAQMAHLGQWKHELASVRIFRHAVEQGLLPTLLDDALGVDRIKAFIIGKVPSSARILPRTKRWMLEVVNNVRSGIDVDRLDYLQRDALHTLGNNGGGLMHVSRLLCNARVSQNGERLLFHVKMLGQLNELFHRRWTMFRMIYSHDTTVALELMLSDFLEHLSGSTTFPLLRETLQTGAVESYLMLDDSLLQQARTLCYMQRQALADGLRGSSEKETIDLALLRACSVLDEIESRRLYECVAQRTLPTKPWRRAIQNTAARPAALLEYIVDQQMHDRVEACLSRFRLHAMRFHYGGGDRNPLDQVRFFEWHATDIPVALSSREHSRLLPRHWSEIVVRLFYRSAPSHETYDRLSDQQAQEDLELIEAVRLAFDAWLKRLLFGNDDEETGCDASDSERTSAGAAAVMSEVDKRNTTPSTERRGKKRRWEPPILPLTK